MAEDMKRETRHRPAMAEAETKDADAAGLGTIKSLSDGISLSLVLILASVATIFAVVFYSAERIDLFANNKSVEQVERLIELELDDVSSISLEYGWWNEMVEEVIYGRNMEWAESNAGGYLQKNYEMDWVLSLDANGELAHGKHGDETIASIPAAVMTPELKQLISEAIHTDFSAPKPASGIIDINGEPGLVGITSFTAYEPTNLEIDRSHGALILIRMLDREFLSKWSEDFQVGELTFISKNFRNNDINIEEYNSLVISDVQGESIGHLIWNSESAGKRFLSLVLPWAIAVGGFILLFSAMFYYKLRSYSRIAQEHLTELNSSRKTLLSLAKYDFLTGLANRSLFVDHVSREISHCIRHKRKSAVIYIDLDGFKSVNDTLGHSTGDELLCLVAEKLTENVRKEDVVSRFGGDEFCILLTDISEDSDIYRVIEKIHHHFSSPFTIGDMRLVIGASLGIVIIPDDTTDCSNVFRFSDIAMYKAKSSGQNGHCFYTSDMEETSRNRTRIKSQLAGAIDRNEFYLEYQPIYTLSDREITGIEALARWQNEELGQVSPAEFIPLAEESDMICHIGYWVFDRALNDLVKITQDTEVELTLSINISARQLRSDDFPSKMEEIRERHGIDLSRIRLEITESLLISEHANEHSVLCELSEKGYRLALDDFGTGYSALGYLQRYPLEVVKIDKSFVSDSLASNAFLIKTIVYMADMAGMTTVAEGIETPEQEEFLSSTGCMYGQGFHFSRPLVLEDTISLLKARQSSLLS